jgi:hypothetical protein
MNIDDQLRMKKAMDALNSKLTLVLPDLMSSNTKLGERLKNKLKVSTLFNNIEHRNRKYLKAFIYNANQRANFLKTGLELNKAIKQSKKNMSSLCKQMEGDLILKNMNILLNEKKLISENTEQETHMKLNNLINTMKRAIKPPLFTKRDEEKKELKILTENEIDKIKDYISDKIIKEKNNLVNNINIYVNELNNSFGNGKYEKGKNKNQIKKEFHRFVDNLNFVKDIKLINFKKPKPIPIKDKESANLLRIKKLLYPTKSIRKEVIEPIKTKEKEYTIIKRNASMNSIYDIKNLDKIGKTVDINEKDKVKDIDVSGQDTMQILNKLAQQKDYLTQRMDNKLRRVNSLIEIKLPFISNYELILKYVNSQNKKGIKNKNLSENNDNEKMKFSPISEDRSNRYKIQPFMRKKILSLKNDINIISHRSELFKKQFYENKQMDIYHKLKESSNKLYLGHASKNDVDSYENTKRGEKVFITSKK